MDPYIPSSIGVPSDDPAIQSQICGCCNQFEGVSVSVPGEALAEPVTPGGPKATLCCDSIKNMEIIIMASKNTKLTAQYQKVKQACCGN